ncbi:MAG TPA: ABC transporter substrate-binding protein [Kiritimatiellia bacterium]|nr:ABC transporter substrate-binding protein [Kiritimatiellia bacterium]HMP33360.1 ABC transporter substrate-binding protein [Kiritimatiellia bacterium]
MKTKRIIIGLLLIILMVGVIYMLNQPNRGVVQVGVLEPMAHPAISDVTQGIRDGLDAESDINLSIVVKNANADSTVIPQIIAQFKDAGVGIFVPIFTGTSQATKNSVGHKPIVFVAVTDPVAAGLVNDTKSPEGNITGVSDLWPIGAQFDLIHQILPEASRIGIVFDPNDPSSAATMPLIREYASAKGFALVERPVHSAIEIASALPVLMGQVDLLFTANDVTVTKALPALVAFAIENKIPLFAGDYSSVQRGAIAAIGQNYYNVGREAAELIAAIHRGDPISSLPIRYTKGGDLHLNVAAAERMGVAIPEGVRSSAQHVYNEISEEGGQ